ncbi:type VII secretion target [Nocardia sp. alder85J]|uniref:type VII secretion target n=1 Tax=Nocardia sp. alder85J TaxID=2862949 RepID=UPI001CD760B7|nr:type VII secretion target [Nocardia sp. alder85J]MCX4096219.1 type VII secretion target [Nocardia sp. alder85J]
MSSVDELRVDPPGLRQLAERAQQSADALGRYSEQLGDIGFGAAIAGRDYAEHGQAVRAGVARVAGRLRQWSDDTAATAAAMRSAAASYTAAEQHNSQHAADTGNR